MRMRIKRTNNKQFFRKKIADLLPNNAKYKTINKSINNTWFNSKFTKSKSDNTPLFPIMNNDDNDNTPLLRVRKVEILFTNPQKNIINEWLQLYKYIYNVTVKYIRLNPNVSKTFYTLRPIIKNSLNSSIKLRIKKSKIPSHTIDNAINDVTKAYKTSFALLKNKRINHFLVRYKKNNSKESLTLESSCFPSYVLLKKKEKQDKITDIDERNNLQDIDLNTAPNTFCPSIFGKEIKSVEAINQIFHDCKLSYHKGTDKYFIFIPIERNREISQNQDTAILDPGMRTFQTCYSKNNIIDYGNNVSIEIKKQLKKADKYNKKESYNRRVYYRTLNHIQNLTNELHHKVSNDLCKRYNCVIIGRLSTIGTNNKKTSCLTKMTKRILQNLSHFRFREILKAKCEERGVKYFEVNEDYTSKTCSHCGNYKKDLGGVKTYKCKKCKITLDRDQNGCRNIFIKNYTSIKEDLIKKGYM